ncbi:MAG: protein translocase subunit SecD [Chloroflexi bacterium]|nr:protein translocase subunit SecD [Chloroflexota bacterium]|tara:strand:- start:7056 stop:8483 length:1428 start_codon:yes stop_codon:yes gene_type:complete
MNLRNLFSLLLVIFLTIGGILVVWPENPGDLFGDRLSLPSGQGVSIFGFEREGMRLGLDLQGGTRLLLLAQPPDDFDGNIDDALEGTLRILRKRVDATGIAEAEITQQGINNISIQLPGLTPQEARDLLGRTAMLRFCEPANEDISILGSCDVSNDWQPANGIVDGRSVVLTGRFLKSNAFVSTDQLGNPAVSFELQGSGPEIFEQITTRQLGKPIAIFLDDELLSAPVVNAIIRGQGQISGLSFERARELVIQLNSGALPLELSVLQEQSVNATLGEESVRKSVVAGIIGLLLVALFMVLYYRLLGLMAAFALAIYAILTLAVFKLIPITITLAGVGAFVLSVGMAVDANILIFERMKEELRSGRAYLPSLRSSYQRAWPAIRDSNVTTLITCAILFMLGGGIELPILGTFDAPLVQGFAITLAIGVLISMFTALTITRIMMQSVLGTPIVSKVELFLPLVSLKSDKKIDSNKR